jgi:hypothetical protein
MRFDPMRFVKGIYADLKEKRLWPVAVGLLIALIAVPVGLSSPSSQSVGTPSASPSPLGGEWSSLLGQTKPIVSLASPHSKYFRRQIQRLARKNPFIQQAQASTKHESLTTTTPGGTNPGPAVGDPSPSVTPPDPTGYTNPGPSSTPAPSPSLSTGGTGMTPAEPKQFNYTASVSFGPVGATEKKTLLPTRPLPNTENPLVVYMGASSGGDEAVFVIFTGAVAQGDGECKPSATKCNFVYLKKGDVEFFEVTGTDGTVTTYELDLEGIGTKLVATGAASASGKRSKHESAAGELK